MKDSGKVETNLKAVPFLTSYLTKRISTNNITHWNLSEGNENISAMRDKSLIKFP